MEITSRGLKVEKTARIVTFGNPEKAKYFILALHGYGQLSRYFIQKFTELSEDYYIVAPEGMHRFYLKDTSGRVGASWMTKEEREDDILDNIQYLNQVMEGLKEYSFERKIILGFSQGGATAARYYHLGKSTFDHLIIWASVFPPDLAIDNEILSDERKLRNYFVVGTSDEYFTEESRAAIIDYFKKMNYSTLSYQGNHSIDPQVLATILHEIE